MSKNDLISVIVPVYKVQDKLAACVQSILAQTHAKLEVILVDDGSPDGCPAMCDSFAERDQRIRVIHKPNGGLSDARNAGLDVASGAWVGFVDSDDWIHSRMFERLLDMAITSEAGISVCNYVAVEEGRTLETSLREHASRSELIPSPTGITALNGKHVQVNGVTDPCFAYGVETDAVLDRATAMTLLLEDKALQNYVWNKLYRRELWDGVRFPVGQYFEDISTTWKLVEKADRIALTAWHGYFYRQRMDSIVHSGDFGMELDCALAGIERYEALKDKYPASSNVMVDNILQSLVKVWGLAWANADRACHEDARHMATLAAFAREHADRISYASQELGITGRMSLRMLGCDTRMAYLASSLFRQAYELKHPRS